MNETGNTDYEALRSLAQELETERLRGELLRLADGLERREAAGRENAERLQAEIERLKLELRKLRMAQADVMSSRLRDALRE
ncbi:hypothetical protein ACFFNY_20025 [Paenibacillus hodogayensis]|uniref:Uncharacterized protein n=1 Tax=Paenibacillus hodogayensis TaxID=279208 RepID=A0ABV5VZY6_9BACL